jgi:hypothetical protein
VQCIRTDTLHFLFLSNCPLLIFLLYFCPGHFSSSMKAMDLKHYRMIDLIDKKCSIQKCCSAHIIFLVIAVCYFSYFIFVLAISPNLHCSQGDTSDSRSSSSSKYVSINNDHIIHNIMYNINMVRID